MKMPRTGVLLDWAKQKIPYRLEMALRYDRDVWECSIDPHAADEWTVFGSGVSQSDAVKRALSAWNEYDQSA